MKIKLQDLEVQSFVTAASTAGELKGGKPVPPDNTQIPCSAIDACPTGYCPYITVLC